MRPISGPLSAARRRTDNLARFHAEPAVGVLWSTDAGALGLNLQAAASCCINLELPWNPAILEQRISRVYRLGQTRPVDVYNLVTIDGVEGRIAQLLAAKQSLATSLFEGDRDELCFEPTASRSTLLLALEQHARSSLATGAREPCERAPRAVRARHSASARR